MFLLLIYFTAYDFIPVCLQCSVRRFSYDIPLLFFTVICFSHCVIPLKKSVVM